MTSDIEFKPTPAQEAALERIKASWGWVGNWEKMVCDNAILVPVSSASGENHMWLGIEPDGYTHS